MTAWLSYILRGGAFHVTVRNESIDTFLTTPVAHATLNSPLIILVAVDAYLILDNDVILTIRYTFIWLRLWDIIPSPLRLCD